ncbi:MAG: sodium-dependent transporter [Clostridia bacterium]|nr:sodium-dependent transporter [Clostridia bacterium]
MGERAKWSSRFTFILASIGSAVGLGNAWRFPGLAAKHGGGTFLVVYLFAMLVMGIPLLMMEIAIARNFRKGAVESMRGIKKGLEPVGWAATSNAFVIVCYYAVVFAWVILMFFNSWKFAGMTGNSEKASSLFFELTKTSGAIKGSLIPGGVFVCLLVAWALIFFCVRNGASSVGKVVKYTVFAPVILLLIMAIKGCTMPGAGEGIAMLLIPDVSALKDPTLWVDAIGQVFYSLSIMMAIMFAYGSYLGDDANIAVDAVIIAFSDMAVSILSAVVMFSTMGGTHMLDNITASGIGTAFIVYPQAIVNLTGIGWFNAIFGAIFYLMLITLAIDSAFSIVEGVSAAVADKFHLKPKTVTFSVCAIAGVISVLFVSEAGLAWLDIVDNWANSFNLIIIGILECIAVGWCFSIRKVLDEINKNTKKFRAAYGWFAASVKYVAPLLLIALISWNIYALFHDNGGSYGGYPIWAQIAAGWAVTVLVFASGFIAKLFVKRMKKQGYTEDEVVWRNS